MADSTYVKTLKKAEGELASLKAQRFEIDNQITHLSGLVRSLKAHVTQTTPPAPSMGLTEGIKTALRVVAPAGLYPPTVRIKLEEAGFKLKGKNPLASIHSILKRLEKQGFIRLGPTREKKLAYFWVTDEPAMQIDLPDDEVDEND